MEPREAAELLALMRGSWPRLAPDEVADRLWLEDLLPLDRDLAHKVWRRLRDQEQHTPSWALFRDVYEDRAQVGVLSRIAIEGPKSTMSYQEVMASREAIKARQREGRVQSMIAERTTRPPDAPGADHDPLTPMLGYDEVYGEPA